MAEDVSKISLQLEENPESKSASIRREYRPKLCQSKWFFDVDCSHPDSAVSVIAQADYCYYQKKWPEAIELYVQGRKLLGDKSPLFQRITLESISRCYVNLEDYKTALMWANDLLDISQSTEHRIVAHNLISTICHKLNNFAEEADHLRYCLWRQPLNGIHWYHLGQCYASMAINERSNPSGLHESVCTSCSRCQTGVNRSKKKGRFPSDRSHLQGNCERNCNHGSISSSRTECDDRNSQTPQQSSYITGSTRTKGGTPRASTDKDEGCLVELLPKMSIIGNGGSETKIDNAENGVCKETEARNHKFIDVHKVNNDRMPFSNDEGTAVTVSPGTLDHDANLDQDDTTKGRTMVYTDLAEQTTSSKVQTWCIHNERVGSSEMRFICKDSVCSHGPNQMKEMGEKGDSCRTRQFYKDKECIVEAGGAGAMGNGIGGSDGTKEACMLCCDAVGVQKVCSHLDVLKKSAHHKYALICYIRARILLKPISSLCNTYHEAVLHEVDEHLCLLGFSEQFTDRVGQLCWKRQFGNDHKQSNPEEKVAAAAANGERMERTFEKYWFEGIVEQTIS